MNVKELIAALQQMPQDFEVYGYCDHGQTPEMIKSPSLLFSDGNHYALFDNWTTNGEDALVEGYVTQSVIL